jgi:hypothetical protein
MEAHFCKTEKIFSERSIVRDEIGIMNGLNVKLFPALKKATVEWEKEMNISVVELLHLPGEAFEREKVGSMDCIAAGLDPRLRTWHLVMTG